MIKIDIHNVEAFYLDYLEGNLSENDTGTLLMFISENPEIAELFDDIDDITSLKLTPTNESFGDTEDLKTFPCDDDEICLSNIDYWLIAKSENTLTKDVEKAVDDFIAINNLEKTEAFIAAANLRPNLSEVFGDTEDLKVFPFNDDQISLSNVDYWLIAKSENELSEDLEKVVDDFVAKNKLENNEALVAAAYLKPDLSEVFGDISVLKKQGGTIIPLLIRFVSVAAIFVFVWLAWNPNKGVAPKYSAREKNNNNIGVATYNSPEILISDVLAASIDKKLENVVLINNPENKNNSEHKTDKSNSEKRDIFKSLFPTIGLSDEVAFNKPPIRFEENIDISSIFSDYEETIAARNNENANNDFASHEMIKPSYHLEEQFRPVTARLSNLTSMDMSYKKMPEVADIKQTVIQIGKFSFDRKRNK